MMHITGVVIEGKKKGRALGFPTANIKISSDITVETGIYAGFVIADEKEYQSALYIAGNSIIEAFLFEFEGDLYGEHLGVKIIKKIRDKKEFKNDQEATEQIAKDITEIKTVLCLPELSKK